MAGFFTNCVKSVIEKAVNIFVRLQGKKKTSTSQNQSFEHNSMEICDQQRLESLEKKKKAVRTSCRHGIRRICKLYTKGLPAGKLTWCEPSSNHLDYRWWDNIQRMNLDTLWELVHSIPNRLENVWNYKGRHSGC